MNIFSRGKARHAAVAAFGAALCMTGLPNVGVAGGAAPGTEQDSLQDSEGAESSRGHGAADTYHIVNLAPGMGYASSINTRGQAAFEYVDLDGRLRVKFFDGEWVSELSPAASSYAALGSMNEKGVIAMSAAMPFGESFTAVPFRWSSTAGLTELPALGAGGYSDASDINDHGDIAGFSDAGPAEGNYRAVRWNPANGLVKLPLPAGFEPSFANQINEHGVSVGSAADPAGVEHALTWDLAGRQTDLGTLGGMEAAALRNNNRGDIAGWVNFSQPNFESFLWSPSRGATRAGLHTTPDYLNNVGELVGRIVNVDTGISHAYVFSRAHGLVDLHRPPFDSSSASQADDKGTVIGEMTNYGAANAGFQRAYRWSRGGEAVDLNTRLFNAPQGLVVTEALRISPRGDIIANSSAGIVLLRRGGGTDAPVLGPVSIPDELRPGQPFAIALSFRDRNKGDTHSATVDWGDGSGPQPAAISERRGSGQLSAAHAYASAADYSIVVRVTDSTGRTTLQAQPVYFTNFPDCMTGIAGQGSLPAATGRAGQATLVFRLAAPLASACGNERQFTFTLQGRIAFKGERLERVSRNGNTVTLEGTGKLGGEPGYRFHIEARDGQHGGAREADRMTVRIAHAEPLRSATASSTQPAVFSYGVADTQQKAAQASREGILAPAALRLFE